MCICYCPSVWRFLISVWVWVWLAWVSVSPMISLFSFGVHCLRPLGSSQLCCFVVRDILTLFVAGFFKSSSQAPRHLLVGVFFKLLICLGSLLSFYFFATAPRSWVNPLLFFFLSAYFQRDSCVLLTFILFFFVLFCFFDCSRFLISW